MKKLHTLILLLTMAFMPLSAFAYTDDLTYMDWREMKIDSILPVYTEVVPLESDYRLYDYSVRVSYPEYAPLKGEEQRVAERYADLLADTLRIDTHVGVMRGKGSLDIAFIPIVRRHGRYEKLISCKLEIVPQPRKQSARAARITRDPATRHARQSVLSQGRWVKISITKDGMYRLTRSALRNMGFSNPDNVRLFGYGGHRLSEVMYPERYYDDLEEVPLYKADADTWLFWGNGVLYWEDNTRIINPYATKGYYFLTEADGPCQIATHNLSDNVSQFATTFTDHVIYEKDEFAYFQGGRNLFDSHDFGRDNSRTYKLVTTDSQGDEVLDVVFSAASATKTTLQTTVNGHALAAATMTSLPKYTYATLSNTTTDVKSYSVGDTWTIKLTTSQTDAAHLDYLALHYTRLLKMPSEGFIAFDASEGKPGFEITCIPEQTRVMQIGIPGKPAVMLGGKTVGGKLRVASQDASLRCVAFDLTKVSTFPQPKMEGEIVNQNLHALDSLDMVIIIPESNKLLREAERLAEAHRTYDALRGAVVRADQVYNEFSSGTPDATAYRMLMKMLYDRAAGNDSIAPRYLLLMGDCAWDNRMLSPAWRNYKPQDYLLCFESENSESDTKCFVMEDYFGLLDDSEGASLTGDKVDLGIGRFPVTTADDARVMVDKTIDYISNKYAGNWKNIVSVLGDDGDDNEHMKYADDVAERIISQYPGMDVRKTMWDAYTRVSTTTSNTYPEVTSIIHDQMKNGVMVMNYTGHGATYCLSHELVLKLADFEQFKGECLPLWITVACDVMPFDGQSQNIGETAVLNPAGGALAFYGTTRTVYAYNNLQMNRYLCRYLFGTDEQGRRYRLGDAIRMAKCGLITAGAEVSNRENKLHYALLGDPAMVIGAPVNHVVLDSINGRPLGDADTTMLQAGMQVCLSGHIENDRHEPLTDFDGVVSACMFDNLETIVCKNNAGEPVDKFTFTNRSKILYNGQDSIRDGRFDLHFVMPVDINYSNLGGRVVLYAINEARTVEANGYSEQFRVGGISPSVGNDTQGPTIFAYLGDPDFVDGGKVTSTPYFVAQLRDESGINFSGNGVGHDLSLTIDNDPAQTYNLNDYYVSHFGDFTGGTVSFCIPTMSEGRHSLTFRAWDVLNNTSSQTLSFEVDGSLKPHVMKLTASQNPAITSTNFLLSYDMPGTECVFHLQVFDFTGREVWSYKAPLSSASGMVSVPWNLTTGLGGRLGAGIYLYRATIDHNGVKTTTKAEKIIIAGNN